MLNKSFLKQPIHWIENEQQLNAVCNEWQRCKLLSVDTEFMRSRTYFPIAGLFQVNDARANYLIDPTTISDFSAFKALLADAKIIKVLHSCSEDLEVFQRVLGMVPANMFDTQIAAAMLGYGFSVGFANLCQAMFGLELPKSETRSDWLQRPLSDAQIQYAALDVEYLTAMAVRLLREAQEAERVLWIKEECDRLIEAFYETQNIESTWQRNKSIWKLDERELYCFQELSRWRELTARKRDVPRNRVVKDHTLLELAQKSPTELGELKRFDGLSPRMLRSDGAELLELIENAKNIPQENLPVRTPRPISNSAKDKIKLLREKVQLKAEQEKISAELLVRKKEYEELMRSGQNEGNWSLPASMQGWRRELVGDLLLKEVRVL